MTRNTFRRRLAALFNFAKRRGYTTQNPIADVERVKERETEIEILSVSQVAKEAWWKEAKIAIEDFWNHKTSEYRKAMVQVDERYVVVIRNTAGTAVVQVAVQP